MDTRIILASASPRRQAILRQVGLVPEVVPSHVDESRATGTPEQIVKELSRRKAEDVAEQICRKNVPEAGGAPGTAVVIGADTVVAVDGRILGKPKSEEEAAAMIRLLAGRVHQVYTGVTLIFLSTGTGAAGACAAGAGAKPRRAAGTAGAAGGGAYEIVERVIFAERTEVEVYPMTEQQIARYVATGEPMDKAGAYGIQGYFAAYVKGIRGDYNNVVGLPAARVCRELAEKRLSAGIL